MIFVFQKISVHIVGKSTGYEKLKNFSQDPRDNSTEESRDARLIVSLLNTGYNTPVSKNSIKYDQQES